MVTDSGKASQFEFSAEHNRHFQSAGYWMGIMGRLWILFGAVACLLAIARGAIDVQIGLGSPAAIGMEIAPVLIFGILTIICGIWTATAAAAFRQVDKSTGRDVDHVMLAIGNLATMYRLQALLIGIAAGLFLAALAVSVVAMLSRGPA
jgi:hypothetical protein